MERPHSVSTSDLGKDQSNIVKDLLIVEHCEVVIVKFFKFFDLLSHELVFLKGFLLDFLKKHVNCLSLLSFDFF